MENEKMDFRRVQFCFMAILTLLTFGCSDGGSYDRNYVTVSGTVSQGKVTDAKVCADLSPFNNRCDAGEPFTYSSGALADAGSYTISNIPEGVLYQLVIEGGIDSLTGLPALSLKAPSGAANITTITTLVSEAADPVAMEAMLNTLSGSLGYDVDFSSVAVPPAFLSLAKSVEKLLVTLASYGLSSPGDQALVFQDIAAELVKPGAANLPLGIIFSNAATTIARRPFSDFNITDAATFASTIGTMATNIATQVNGAPIDGNGNVLETVALQNLIDTNVIVPALPVGSVSLYADTISILRTTDSLIQSVSITPDMKFADLSMSSGDFQFVQILVNGSNTFSPATDKSYTAAFNMTVSDKTSNRSLQVIVSGVTVAVDSSGGVTLIAGSTAAMTLRGVNSDGSVVVEKSLTRGSWGGDLTIANNLITFNIDLLKAEVEIAAGPVGLIGSYTVSTTISGVPGVPAAVNLTLN